MKLQKHNCVQPILQASLHMRRRHSALFIIFSTAETHFAHKIDFRKFARELRVLLNQTRVRVPLFHVDSAARILRQISIIFQLQLVVLLTVAKKVYLSVIHTYIKDSYSLYLTVMLPQQRSQVPVQRLVDRQWIALDHKPSIPQPLYASINYFLLVETYTSLQGHIAHDSQLNVC